MRSNPRRDIPSAGSRRWSRPGRGNPVAPRWARPESFSRCYATCACGTKLSEGFRRPCRGQTCGGMLGAMAHIVAAGACPRNCQPLLRRLRLRHKSSARPPAALPGADVWGHAWGDGAHCRLHYPCTAAEPFSNRETIPFARASVARVVADILHCNKFSQTDRRDLLRIENCRKSTRMSRSHSRSVKGPPCGAGLAPGTQEPHRPPPPRAVNKIKYNTNTSIAKPGNRLYMHSYQPDDLGK